VNENAGERSWTPTANQVERARRSLAILERRAVPVLRAPLLYVDDDGQVTLRTGPEVARRALALWAVVLRAENMPADEVGALLDGAGVRDAVTPEEAEFLRDEDPDPDDCQRWVWRLEGIWVLLWALGHVAELDWPRDMCDGRV
jgi:hypothetical protein